jgi:LruC domain-containing protein
MYIFNEGIKMKLAHLASACLVLIPYTALSQPFDVCPSQAFLMQNSKAQLYGIDLVSAKPTILASALYFQDEENNEGINAVGFNYKDQYLYGFSKQSPASVVRINNEYVMDRLTVTGLPDTNFYIGDVQIVDGDGGQSATYYVYTPKLGLYAVSLDGSIEESVAAEFIDGSDTWKISVFDFAFHPHSNLLYALENDGSLYEIDIAAQTNTFITQVDVGDETGAFGAAYFDVNGQFYVSNNKSGKIHKIDLETSPVVGYTPAANVFTSGPSSSQNDGARCATAEVEVTDSSIDFGDAPAPYNTSLAQSGARHLINTDNEKGVYLGASIDGENINSDEDLIASPVDSSDDGVYFVTDFAAGQQTQIIVNASTNSYLYVWFDWDQNGVFDDDELMLTKHVLNEGDNSILVTVPEDTKAGETWTRFRVTDGTEASFITATGGVNGGEVEDYKITTFASAVYPGENEWVTLAYEDKWPFAGDYDFNDVVVNYRTTQLTENDHVVSYKIEGELVGIGATYHNGFAVRLYEKLNDDTVKRVLSSNVDEQNITFTVNNELQTGSFLEADREEAIIILMQDTWDYVQKQSGCSYYRTEFNCNTDSVVSFSMTIPLIEPMDTSIAPGTLLDPFIFASTGFYHGDFLVDKNARGWEVHMKNQTPTEAFDTTLFNTTDSDDVSNPDDQFYFQTSNGLPWAIEVATQWLHPRESIDITDAYDDFSQFAESAGTLKTQWYNSYNSNSIIESGDK